MGNLALQDRGVRGQSGATKRQRLALGVAAIAVLLVAELMWPWAAPNGTNSNSTGRSDADPIKTDATPREPDQPDDPYDYTGP